MFIFLEYLYDSIFQAFSLDFHFTHLVSLSPIFEWHNWIVLLFDRSLNVSLTPFSRSFSVSLSLQKKTGLIIQQTDSCKSEKRLKAKNKYCHLTSWRCLMFENTSPLCPYFYGSLSLFWYKYIGHRERVSEWEWEDQV